MVVIDGYTLEHYPDKAKIVITLPQTVKTANNTYSPVKERKEEITDNEKSIILCVVKAMFEDNYTMDGGEKI